MDDTSLVSLRSGEMGWDEMSCAGGVVVGLLSWVMGRQCVVLEGRGVVERDSEHVEEDR
jgi:hypothetical protein